jgi:chromatin segregation and condensation protein Rec8/ScpA/Scc1 (kleisin family)
MYERQEGETIKAFEAFSKYRDMGMERSLRKVAQELSKSETIIKRWSSQWNWVERVKIYDAEMDRQTLLQEQKSRKDMVKRHAALANTFLSKVLERIRELNPAELSTNDLIRWFEISVKIERLSRGEPTDISSLEHGGEVNQKHEHSFEAEVAKYADMYDRIRNGKA